MIMFYTFTFVANTPVMHESDIFEMMFELRGGIGRNRFGLLHEGLFSKAMAGSKVLVET